MGFIRNFFSSFSNDLSIDLGTANTLIYEKNNGIILNEPSIIAVRQEKSGEPSQVVAVGLEAKHMLGRTPSGMQVIRPMKDGVIADFTMTEEMLGYFIRRVNRPGLFKPMPRILICVPCGATQVELRAIRDSAASAGASAVFLIKEPIAAAIGAGLPIDQAVGSMVLDIGGGTSEVAIMSLNGIVYASSVRIGGDQFDQSIVSWVRKNHAMLIGDSTAEYIKHTIGTAYPTRENIELEVRGRNISEGIPRSIKLTSNEVLESFQEPLAGIVGAVKTALERTPPELGSDVSERGLVLTGGGALLAGIDQLIQEETGLPVIIAEDPLTCVVRGGGQALESLNNNRGAYNVILE
ncbi:MAG: rod shape-determining protein [Gammaproteobacteria bacterium]|nr:rod shape-determining protein [Pseudomonadota bacterium]MCH9663101.1 rod shape-determining protein [Gammaproteobacteria bacterium]